MSITVYTKNNCPQCKFVKKELNDKGVKFDEINMDEDESVVDLLKSKGFRAAPVTITNGEWDNPILGFNRVQINNLIKSAI